MSGEDSNSYPLDVLKTDADTDHEVIDLGFRIKTFALYSRVCYVPERCGFKV